MSTYAMASAPGPITPMPGMAADMQRAVAERERVNARRFTGMVFPDHHPVTVDDRWVCRVNGLDIPLSLREFAQASVGVRPNTRWQTIGEFRYADTPYHDYVTAVARWHRTGLQYGLEGDVAGD